jgi:hypothetical protein
MPEDGTKPRCAFWFRPQPLRITAPMVIVKNSNHTPKDVSVAQDSVLSKRGRRAPQYLIFHLIFHLISPLPCGGCNHEVGCGIWRERNEAD